MIKTERERETEIDGGRKKNYRKENIVTFFGL